MNKAEIRKYIKNYVPYSNNPIWVEWYSTVAPIKAWRTIKMLKKYKDKKAKVLDCGCGIGLTLYYISQYFKNSEGIDIDVKNINIARKQFSILKNKTPLHVYDGKKLPYPDNFFDMVLSIEVWEHAQDTRTMLKEIARVLKPDGILHVTTANKLWPLEPHYKLLFLSYLPSRLADWYVRITGRSDFYHDIHLPFYGEFRKSVEEFFYVSDITFDTLINYKEVGLHKERGSIIILIGALLKFIKKFDRVRILSTLTKVMYAVLSNISLGWLFIAYPKKNLLPKMTSNKMTGKI